MVALLGRVLAHVRSLCSQPSYSSEHDDSHDWYQFRDNEWKCATCGKVIGWPGEERREQMGVEYDG